MNLGILSNDEETRARLDSVAREAGDRVVWSGDAAVSAADQLVQLRCDHAIVDVTGVEARTCADMLSSLARGGALVAAVSREKMPEASSERSPGLVTLLTGDQDRGREVLAELRRRASDLARLRPAERPAGEPPGSPDLGGLSDRDVELLCRLEAGLRYGDIAQSMNLSESTVKMRIAAIRRRTGRITQFQLGSWAARLGILEGGSRAP